MITKMLFDYGGYYSKCREEDKWISKEGFMYAVMFKTSSLEEITYSVIVDRICKKVGVAESTTMLKLSYIPIVVKTQRQLYILDDEDVYVYLTSLDKEQHRSVLNVEVVEVSKDVEINELGEQFSRVEHISSFGVNYGDNGIANVGVNYGNGGVNDGVIAIYTGNCSTEQHHEPIENAYCENVDGANVDGENASREDGDNDEDNGLESSRRLEIVEFPRTGEEQQSVDAWEDGMGLKVSQEFESKQELIYVIARASHQNCFEITLSKSDKSRYVVKCGKDVCNWYLRATKATNASFFTVRVYKKMHTCSRATSSTSIKQRKGTRGLVASIVSELYPGQLELPSPKILVILVQRNASVNVSYCTAGRGKQKTLSMLRGSPEESYNDLYSYLYMLEQVNPDTRTNVLWDEQKRFKYVLVALGACIERFRAMRKVIIMDATFLKNQHGGVLIFATAQDPNHHHYPIAFVVVDAKNN